VVYQNVDRCEATTVRADGELVERGLAHCYQTGGMRRTHLRGPQNILKWQLIHVDAFNLSLILRKMLGRKRREREIASAHASWDSFCGPCVGKVTAGSIELKQYLRVSSNVLGETHTRTCRL
jgi:hypothetical protein